MLGFIPKIIILPGSQILKRKIPFISQFLQYIESLCEFVVCIGQCVLWLDVFLPAEIDYRKQKISEFIHGLLVGFCIYDFLQFFLDLVDDAFCIRPVEPDLDGFLGNAVATLEFRSAFRNACKEIFR